MQQLSVCLNQRVALSRFVQISSSTVHVAAAAAAATAAAS